jgi:flavorubredoxin
MSYSPQPPTTRVEPERVGPDTWVIHQVQEALGAPLFVYLNSMVIAGDEPVIVDTGSLNNREQFLEDVFGIVEPTDVRWVFLSHDDHDHTGNLEPVMEACPNATLVCSWAIHERFSNAFELPLSRCRWVNDGESFDAGKRRLVAVRPPVFDSPATRGLFDASTGVYWGVDSFAAPCPGAPLPTVAELEPEFWAEGMAMFIYNALSPWIAMVDQAKFAASVERVRTLGATTIATAHSPLIPATHIDEACRILASLPSVDAPPCPDQSALDAVLGVVPA